MLLKGAGSLGFGIAKAGTMGALSLGSNVVSGGSNIVKGGFNTMYNFMNRKNKLSPDQMSEVKESMNNQNNFKAQKQVSDFVNKNRNKNPSASGSFSQPINMQYNPLKNVYMHTNKNLYDKGRK